MTSLSKYIDIKPKNDFVFCPYNIYQGLFSAYLITSGFIEEHLKEILYLTGVSKRDLINTISFNKYADRNVYRNVEENQVNCTDAHLH